MKAYLFCFCSTIMRKSRKNFAITKFKKFQIEISKKDTIFHAKFAV